MSKNKHAVSEASAPEATPSVPETTTPEVSVPAIPEVVAPAAEAKVKAVRKADINDNPEFSVESRNAEIATIAGAITQSGIRCEIATDENTLVDRVIVNPNLSVMNEFFKNGAIGKSEWKARIYLRGKLVTHYKAKHTSKIVDKVTALLPISVAEVTPAA